MFFDSLWQSVISFNLTIHKIEQRNPQFSLSIIGLILSGFCAFNPWLSRLALYLRLFLTVIPCFMWASQSKARNRHAIPCYWQVNHRGWQATATTAMFTCFHEARPFFFTLLWMHFKWIHKWKQELRLYFSFKIGHLVGLRFFIFLVPVIDTLGDAVECALDGACWMCFHSHPLGLQLRSNTSTLSSSYTTLCLCCCCSCRLVTQLWRFIHARHSVTDSHSNQLVVLTSAPVANSGQLKDSRWNSRLWNVALHYMHQSTYRIDMH